MAEYRISGVWKNENGVITAYAFHTYNRQANTLGKATKVLKAEAIRLLEINGNSAVTWVWDYKIATWKVEANVEVVNGATGKYLRSDRDNKTTDNLDHLIDLIWFPF